MNPSQHTHTHMHTHAHPHPLAHTPTHAHCQPVHPVQGGVCEERRGEERRGDERRGEEMRGGERREEWVECLFSFTTHPQPSNRDCIALMKF